METWGESSCLTDRQACDGWRQVCLMKHGRSQIPGSPLIEPTEGGLCCGKVPQSGSEEEPVFPQVKRKLASRGNNVYVLDFKRFLPVRNPDVKVCSSASRIWQISFFSPLSLSRYFLLLGAVMEWQSLALHHLNTQRMFELNMHAGRSRMCCSAFFQNASCGQSAFPHSLRHLKVCAVEYIKKKTPTIKGNIS